MKFRAKFQTYEGMLAFMRVTMGAIYDSRVSPIYRKGVVVGQFLTYNKR